jgi:hypothetical protein
MGPANLPCGPEDFYNRRIEHGPPVFDGVQTGPGGTPGTGPRPAVLRPAVFWPSGWLATDFDSPDTDWAEIAELIETSYRQVALKRQLAALERGRSRKLI